MATTIVSGRFEWDSEKAAANLKKHRVAFENAEKLDFSKAVATRQDRSGETRYELMAPMGQRVHVMVITLRNERVRVTSLRKANSRATARYEQVHSSDV